MTSRALAALNQAATRWGGIAQLIQGRSTRQVIDFRAVMKRAAGMAMREGSCVRRNRWDS